MQARPILVVGGGITGVCAAEWLRRDGWSVTLVDRVSPGDPDQTSYGNAGLLANTSVLPVSMPGLLAKAPGMLLDPDSPLFLRWRYLPRLLPWLVPYLRNGNVDKVMEIAASLSSLTHDAVEQHQNLAKGTPAADFIETGELVELYRSRADFDANRLGNSIREKYGLVPGHLDREQLVERDPHLGPSYTFGAVFKDFAWISSPGSYVAALFDHFLAQGGRFKRAEVVDIRAGMKPSLTLPEGEVLQGEKIILCAGAWSAKLSRKLGVSVKLEAERGYHVSMHNPNFSAPQPYVITDAKFVVTPMAGALRAAGVVEFGGSDAPAAKAPTDLLTRHMRRVYPGLQFEYQKVWMGRRPTTPDSLPVVGESVNAPNVVHAYGGQHVGLTIGPKIARMVADLASRRQTNVDLEPYRVDRF
ncbi:NAD(P)/FAD-dependent oxidoreductase [Hoeflea ulvae]|uniref:FAD-binding oxidoreductase n=1 Tax=Hoeflea ulvae TaxID=2983764 RepID=A0ABT3YLF9_9HYPH|nr:FAD-binding oxidoreductase [Hoeflea ulvae]MCY0096712.1 FAD-binding oxidoreductase [Hoeflea ulvae]